MWVAFAKATHIFFSKKISIYAIFNDQRFNDTLTNDIVSFEQLDPGLVSILHNIWTTVFTTKAWAYRVDPERDIS